MGFVNMANKSVVISCRITDKLQVSLQAIADKYGIPISQLVSAVLTSFVNEFVKSLVVPDVIENAKGSQ